MIKSVNDIAPMSRYTIFSMQNMDENDVVPAKYKMRLMDRMRMRLQTGKGAARSRQSWLLIEYHVIPHNGMYINNVMNGLMT